MTRRFFRRLRYPIFAGSHVSKSVSDEATEFIYTGGFGENDIFHTTVEGLEAMEDEIRRLARWQGIPLVPDLRLSELRLFFTLFNRAHREALARSARSHPNASESALSHELLLHERQLVRGRYHQAIDHWRNRQVALPGGGSVPHPIRLTERAAQELRDAFTLDAQFESDYSKPPGIGGFMIALLVTAQNEIERSRAAVGRTPVTHPGSDKGASEELIGTHTLMAKDSPVKAPFYEEALALASHASASIACLLARRVNGGNDREVAHWEAIVRHFIRYPSRDPQTWENLVLGWRGMFGRQPVVEDIADEPRFRALPLQSHTVQRLLKERKRAVLEQRYIGMEREVEWRAAPV